MHLKFSLELNDGETHSDQAEDRQTEPICDKLGSLIVWFD